MSGIDSEPKADKARRVQMAKANVQNTVANIQAQELRENRKVVEVARRLRAIGMDDALNQMMGVAATTVAQQTYTHPQAPTTIMVERFQGRGAGPVINGDWSPITVIKESGGKELTRYRVKHVGGDMVAHDFRAERVALMAAAILNETGNKSDPRLVRIIELCQQETAAIAEVNQTKRLLAEVDPGNVKRKGIYETKLENAKLRLENVRLKLGA